MTQSSSSPDATTIKEDYVCRVCFSPEGNGLRAGLFLSDRSEWFEGHDDFIKDYGKPSEHYRNISISVDVSKDHGLITVPIRLPRYLMPHWSAEDWAGFIDSEMQSFHRWMEEGAVQCLSLAIMHGSERGKEVLKEANGVVIDFRGDLPNLYLPMSLGGYKVGIYRKNNSWPIWTTIQPTYELALEEATKLRDELKLPKSSITAVGALQDVLKVNMGPLPISSKIEKRGILLLAAFCISIGIAIGVAIGWLVYRSG